MNIETAIKFSKENPATHKNKNLYNALKKQYKSSVNGFKDFSSYIVGVAQTVSNALIQGKKGDDILKRIVTGNTRKKRYGH